MAGGMPFLLFWNVPTIVTAFSSRSQVVSGKTYTGDPLKCFALEAAVWHLID